MAAEHVEDHIDVGEEGDDFIHPNDVVDVIDLPEDGDLPMDEDDEDGNILAAGGSFHIDDEGNLQPDEPEGDENADYEDTSLRHFPNHHRSVFVVSTHPSATLAASGG